MNKTKITKPNKVCPVLLRYEGDERLILAFRHPLAGYQLVKGTIERGETESVAVLRELSEESGITSAAVVRHLGVWDSGYDGQIWSLYLCCAETLPDQWTHCTQDDGGLEFTFFWQPLDETLDAKWHPLYQKAIKHILSFGALSTH